MQLLQRLERQNLSEETSTHGSPESETTAEKRSVGMTKEEATRVTQQLHGKDTHQTV